MTFAPEPLATPTPTLPSWIVTATVRAFAVCLLWESPHQDVRAVQTLDTTLDADLGHGWARAGSPARMRSAVAGPLEFRAGRRVEVLPWVPLPVSPHARSRLPP